MVTTKNPNAKNGSCYIKKGNSNAGRPPKWTEKEAIQLANDLVNWIAEDGNVYWKRFIVLERRLRPQLISELSEKYPEFAELIKIAREIQEVKLAEMSGHDTIKSIFMLKNYHGYADKTEVKSENVTTIKDMRNKLAEMEAMTEDQLVQLSKDLLNP